LTTQTADEEDGVGNSVGGSGKLVLRGPTREWITSLYGLGKKTTADTRYILVSWGNSGDDGRGGKGAEGGKKEGSEGGKGGKLRRENIRLS